MSPGTSKFNQYGWIFLHSMPPVASDLAKPWAQGFEIFPTLPSTLCRPGNISGWELHSWAEGSRKEALFSQRWSEAYRIWENLDLQKPRSIIRRARKGKENMTEVQLQLLQHNQWASGGDATQPPAVAPILSGKGGTYVHNSQLFWPWDPSNSSQFVTTCPACRILGPLNHRLRCRANQGALRHHRAPVKGKGNIKASSGDCEAAGGLPLPWVTDLTCSACAQPPGSGSSTAPHACLLCGRRNYNSQGDPEAALATERSFQLCLGPGLNLENAAGAPGCVLFKEEDGAESLETIYQEAESQGDPSQSGALGGAGTDPVGSRAGLRFLLLPPGASLLGSPLPWLPWSQHCPGEGGLWTLGSRYLLALMGSTVKELFPSNAFHKPERSGSTHPGEENSPIPLPPIPTPTILGKFLHISLF